MKERTNTSDRRGLPGEKGQRVCKNSDFNQPHWVTSGWGQRKETAGQGNKDKTMHSSSRINMQSEYRERGNHNANIDINSIYTSIEKYKILTQRSKQRTLSLSTSNIMAISWITWVILRETHQITSVTQCSWHMSHSMSEGDLKTTRGWMNCKGTGRSFSWQQVKHEKLYWLTQDLKEEIFISSVHSADTQKCQVLIFIWFLFF